MPRGWAKGRKVPRRVVWLRKANASAREVMEELERRMTEAQSREY